MSQFFSICHMAVSFVQTPNENSMFSVLWPYGPLVKGVPHVGHAKDRTLISIRPSFGTSKLSTARNFIASSPSL